MRTLSLAWTGVRRRGLRSLLTCLSLVLGILTVVLVQSSGLLVQRAALHQAVLDAGPATTLTVTTAPVAGWDPTPRLAWWEQRLTALTTDLDGRVAARMDFPGLTLVDSAGIASSVDVAAVGTATRTIRPFPVVRGTWVRPSTTAPRVVVNRAASALWGPVRITGAAEPVTAYVVGVVDDGTSTPAAYLDLGAGSRLVAAGLEPSRTSLLLSSAAGDAAVLKARVLDLAARSDTAVEVLEVTRTDSVGQYDDQLATTRTVFLGIALLVLLVGALGVLNIGLATLRERAEELALRRALGASRAEVARIVLCEAVLLAVGAGAIAAAAAYLVVPGAVQRLSTIPLTEPGVPLAALAWGACAGLLATGLGALAPSVLATRADVADLMR